MLAVTGSAEFGRYRLEQLLGRGGMGEVYRARDTALDRDVAIKVLPPGAIADAPARARLLREAKAAAALDHPGICTVYEAGETPDGRAFIAMQLVEGESLAERVRRGPLPVREALDLCAQIAEALGAAHKHGIVHRDLKPGNVIVGPSGRPVLLDFGIAKVITARLGSDSTTVSDATTGSALIGTPSYMSPEQVQQRPVDGRTDLFALGVLFYECLTGQRPFDAPSAVETIANVLHVQPAPPSTLRRELTDRHDLLCARLLAKEPADRFQSADEVIGAVRVLTVDTGRITGTQMAPLPQPAWKRLPRATLLLLALAVAGGAAAWWWTRPKPLPIPPPQAQALYDKGTEALREGAYHRARTNLQEAIRLFPQFALAYARLAEADTELDDDMAAQSHLLAIPDIVSDESRLPDEERLRLRAVRALARREHVEQAIDAYRVLAERQPADTRAWLDLGRAQESADLRADAAQSYARAIAQDGTYAAPWLRLGSIEGANGQLAKALDSFDHAERLYTIASDVEGQTEVLLRRAVALDAMDRIAEARTHFERALAMASSSGSVNQQIRARLGVGSVLGSLDQAREAERTILAAVEDALDQGFDGLAVEGLVDLSIALVGQERYADARAQVDRAIERASARRAVRSLHRAQLQRAEISRLERQPAEALKMVDAVLPFFVAHSYRRYELLGLIIAARCRNDLGQKDEAEKIVRRVLHVAETIPDETRVALASSDLAAGETARGRYPGALRLRERAESIYRARGDSISLPYALANRADLLVRLGRPQEAARLLDELEAGIAEKKRSYISRSSRVTYFRAMIAATGLDCTGALRALAGLGPDPASSEPPEVVGGALRMFCRARGGHPVDPPGSDPAGADPVLLAERDYWRALAASTAGRPRDALAIARSGIARVREVGNDELEFRLALAGAGGARGAGDEEARRQLLAEATAAEGRVRTNWGPAFETYTRRPDIELARMRAGS